jgi:hypothetical protein
MGSNRNRPVRALSDPWSKAGAAAKVALDLVVANDGIETLTRGFSVRPAAVYLRRSTPVHSVIEASIEYAGKLTLSAQSGDLSRRAVRLGQRGSPSDPRGASPRLYRFPRRRAASRTFARCVAPIPLRAPTLARLERRALDFCSGSERRPCASWSSCQTNPLRSIRGCARDLAVARQLPRPWRGASFAALLRPGRRPGLSSRFAVNRPTELQTSGASAQS